MLLPETRVAAGMRRCGLDLGPSGTHQAVATCATETARPAVKDRAGRGGHPAALPHHSHWKPCDGPAGHRSLRKKRETRGQERETSDWFQG